MWTEYSEADRGAGWGYCIYASGLLIGNNWPDDDREGTIRVEGAVFVVNRYGGSGAPLLRGGTRIPLGTFIKGDGV